jgi:hypothetical protein
MEILVEYKSGQYIKINDRKRGTGDRYFSTYRSFSLSITILRATHIHGQWTRQWPQIYTPGDRINSDISFNNNKIYVVYGK